MRNKGKAFVHDGSDVTGYFINADSNVRMNHKRLMPANGRTRRRKKVANAA